MCADVAAVQKRHAKLRPPAALLRQRQQALPYAQVEPTVVALRGHPPRAKRRWNRPPLGAVVMPPNDRLDRAPQLMRLRLAVWPHRLNQWPKPCPHRVRKDAIKPFVVHPYNMGIYLKP